MHELNDLIDVANGHGEGSLILLSRPHAERVVRVAKKTGYQLTKADLKPSGGGFEILGGKLKDVLKHAAQQMPDVQDEPDLLDLLEPPPEGSKEELASQQADVKNRTQNQPPQARLPNEPTRTVEGGHDDLDDEDLDDEESGPRGAIEPTGESEVADKSAEEAKDVISRMRSAARLRDIMVNDSRSTVQTAARERLEAIGG